MFGKKGEETLGLCGSEVVEGDGVVVGGVVDGKVNTFVGEIGEELVEEVEGSSVDACHNIKYLEVFEISSDLSQTTFII